jgi:hypothetical protein
MNEASATRVISYKSVVNDLKDLGQNILSNTLIVSVSDIVTSIKYWEDEKSKMTTEEEKAMANHCLILLRNQFALKVQLSASVTGLVIDDMTAFTSPEDLTSNSTENVDLQAAKEEIKKGTLIDAKDKFKAAATEATIVESEKTISKEELDQKSYAKSTFFPSFERRQVIGTPEKLLEGMTEKINATVSSQQAYAIATELIKMDKSELALNLLLDMLCEKLVPSVVTVPSQLKREDVERYFIHTVLPAAKGIKPDANRYIANIDNMGTLTLKEFEYKLDKEVQAAIQSTTPVQDKKPGDKSRNEEYNKRFEEMKSEYSKDNIITLSLQDRMLSEIPTLCTLPLVDIAALKEKDNKAFYAAKSAFVVVLYKIGADPKDFNFVTVTGDGPILMKMKDWVVTSFTEKGEVQDSTITTIPEDATTVVENKDAIVEAAHDQAVAEETTSDNKILQGPDGEEKNKFIELTIKGMWLESFKNKTFNANNQIVKWLKESTARKMHTSKDLDKIIKALKLEAEKESRAQTSEIKETPKAAEPSTSTVVPQITKTISIFKVYNPLWTKAQACKTLDEVSTLLTGIIRDTKEVVGDPDENEPWMIANNLGRQMGLSKFEGLKGKTNQDIESWIAEVIKNAIASPVLDNPKPLNTSIVTPNTEVTKELANVATITADPKTSTLPKIDYETIKGEKKLDIVKTKAIAFLKNKENGETFKQRLDNLIDNYIKPNAQFVKGPRKQVESFMSALISKTKTLKEMQDAEAKIEEVTA